MRVIYECEFAQMKKDIPNLNTVIRDMLPEIYYDNPHTVSEQTILESLESGYLTKTVRGRHKCTIRMA